MIKTCCLLFLVCFTCSCFAQTKDTYYGVVLTRINREDNSSDTTLFLYGRNLAGDRLSVYTVTGGLVSEAFAFQLTQTNKGLSLYSDPLLPGQQMKDSLRIDFQDKTHAVAINCVDRYVLFPNFYTHFKQDVRVKHSIIALFSLLSDGLGDYPIAAALHLVNFRPHLNKQNQQASIVTQRSQVARKDTLTCRYFYNKANQLDSINASSPEEIRFYKKVHYNKNGKLTINTYRNIESRQTINRIVKYGTQSRSTIKWREQYDETGKNRETISSATLTWHDLGMLRELVPSNAEVLNLLKPIKTNDTHKKHID